MGVRATLLKNESGSMLLYAIIVSLAIFLGSFYLSELQPTVFELQSKHSKNIRAKAVIDSILDYSIYAIQNRWCLNKDDFKRLRECNYDTPTNTERLIVQKATEIALNEIIQLQNPSAEQVELELKKIEIPVSIPLTDRLHPLHKVIENFRAAYPSFKKFTVVLNRERNEYLPGSKEGGHIWVSIKVELQFDSKSLVSGESLVSFTPRKLTFFPLVLAGSMDLTKDLNDCTYELDNTCLDEKDMRFHSPVLLHKGLTLPNSSERTKILFRDKVVFDNSPDAFLKRSSGNDKTIKVRGIHVRNNKRSSGHANDILRAGFLQDTYSDNGLKFLNKCVGTKRGKDCPNTPDHINEDNMQACIEYYNISNELGKLKKTKNSNLLIKKNIDVKSEEVTLKQGFYFMLSQNNTFKAMSENNHGKKEITFDGELSRLEGNNCDNELYNKWRWLRFRIDKMTVKDLAVCSKWEIPKRKVTLTKKGNSAPTPTPSTTSYWMHPTFTLKPVLVGEKNTVRNDMVYLDIEIKFTKKFKDDDGNMQEKELKQADIENVDIVTEGIQLEIIAHEFGGNERTQDDKGACFSNKAEMFLEKISIIDNLGFTYYESSTRISHNSNRKMSINDGWKITDKQIIEEINNPLRETKCGSDDEALYSEKNSWQAPKVDSAVVDTKEVIITDSNWKEEEAPECDGTINVSADTWVTDHSSETLHSWNFEPHINNSNDPKEVKYAKNLKYTIEKDPDVKSIVGDCIIEQGISQVIGFYFCAKSLTIKDRDKPLTIIGTIITPKLIVETDERVHWYSIYHPRAIKKLSRIRHYAHCRQMPSHPPWHPDVGIDVLSKWKKCSPNALPGATSPFSWTTLDPDTINSDSANSKISLERPRRFLTTEYGRHINLGGK